MIDTATELLYPLSYFRERDGRSLPAADAIDGDAMPEPYRGLLVHTGDMTSRLEKFHGAPMTLDVLHREVTGEAYRREVLLRASDTGMPVEYGAIEICLEEFGPEVRGKILEGRVPLGGLLNSYKLAYFSQPKVFIELASDEVMSSLFAIPHPHRFYGRCNELRGGEGQLLARIVEILRP